MQITVETDHLLTDAMLARYGRGNDKTLAGIQATLDALGIELPDQIKRKKPGRKPNPAAASRQTLWRRKKAAAGM